MSLTYPAIVTDTTSQMLHLSVERSACGACRSGCKESVRLQLPSDVLESSYLPAVGAGIEVSMSLREQTNLLLNSLMLPMAGFVLGSCLATWIDPSDPVVVMGALVGFLAGVVVCKRASFKALRFKPV